MAATLPTDMQCGMDISMPTVHVRSSYIHLGLSTVHEVDAYRPSDMQIPWLLVFTPEHGIACPGRYALPRWTVLSEWCCSTTRIHLTPVVREVMMDTEIGYAISDIHITLSYPVCEVVDTSRSDYRRSGCVYHGE